jgi:hypothetical protein
VAAMNRTSASTLDGSERLEHPVLEHAQSLT